MEEFLEFFDFLWFSLLSIPATQSLALPSPRDRKVYDTSRRRHISCLRPISPQQQAVMTPVVFHCNYTYRIPPGLMELIISLYSLM